MLRQFRLNETIQITPVEQLTADWDAALIFGGDGTVHRHLPQLHATRIPVLVVPCGSGNDFAKALGIRSVEIALRAWQQFCADGNNVREIDLGVVRARIAAVQRAVAVAPGAAKNVPGLRGDIPSHGRPGVRSQI